MPVLVTSSGHEVLVDEADVPLVGIYRWSTFKAKNDSLYVVRQEGGKTVYLHRVVMGVTDPKIEVDHRSGNTLDNRRSNLRVTSHRLNLANQRPQVGRASVYKGVSRNRKRWAAKIKVDGVMRHLGTYDTEEEAARVYDEAAIEAWGEYARPNFSPSFV